MLRTYQQKCSFSFHSRNARQWELSIVSGGFPVLCPPWVIPGTVIWIFLLPFPVAHSLDCSQAHGQQSSLCFCKWLIVWAMNQQHFSLTPPMAQTLHNSSSAAAHSRSSSMAVIFTQKTEGEEREEREEMGWVITQWTAVTPLKIQNQ